MKTYRIAVIAGDGIGKEVIPAGISVLNMAAEQADFRCEFTSEPNFLLGGTAHLGDDAGGDGALANLAGIFVGRKRFAGRLDDWSRSRRNLFLIGLLLIGCRFLI